MIKSKNLKREVDSHNLEMAAINRSLGRVVDNVVTSLDLTIPAPVVLTGIGFGIIGINFRVG